MVSARGVIKIWRALAAAAVVLAGVFGALFAAGTATAGAASSDTSKSPLTIGYICSCTGPLASSVETGRPAFQSWVSWVNAQGGVNGHKIKVIYKDDDTSPTTSLQEVQSLLQSNVLAIVDLSNADSAWGNLVTQQNVPVIEANSSNTVALTSAMFFPASQTIDSLPISIVLAAKKTGAKNLGLVYCAEAPACQELVGPEKAIAEKNGLPLVYNSSVSAAAPSFAAECLAAQQAGAKSLFVADAVQVALHVAADCVKQGYHPTLIAEDGAVATSFATAPGWNNNMVATQPNIPFFVRNTPATKTMYAAFKKYQPAMLKDPNYNELAVEGWAAGLLLGKALAAGHVGDNGQPATSQLLDGLYSLHNETLGGIAPPLTFTKGKPNLIDCWFYMRTSNSKFTTPYGLKPACAPGFKSGK